MRIHISLRSTFVKLSNYTCALLTTFPEVGLFKLRLTISVHKGRRLTADLRTDFGVLPPAAKRFTEDLAFITERGVLAAVLGVLKADALGVLAFGVSFLGVLGVFALGVSTFGVLALGVFKSSRFTGLGVAKSADTPSRGSSGALISLAFLNGVFLPFLVTTGVLVNFLRLKIKIMN